MKPGRFFFKIAAWWLLVSAAAHLVGHYVFYIDEGRFTPERLGVARQMQALVADPEVRPAPSLGCPVDPVRPAADFLVVGTAHDSRTPLAVIER